LSRITKCLGTLASVTLVKKS